MALYRLHKVEWEQELRPVTELYKAKLGKGKNKEKEKRKRQEDSEEGDGSTDEEVSSAARKRGRGNKGEISGGGRKGVSSGMSVVVRRNGQRVEPKRRGVTRDEEGGGSVSAGKSGSNWWETV
jgi:RNA exonuclease 4